MSANPLLLLPDFGVILLGVALARFMKFGADFWSGAERLVYYVLLPPMLFMAINSAKFSFQDATHFMVVGVVIFGLGIAASYLAQPLLRSAPQVFAACVQTGFRFNSYIGLALAATLWGPKSVALFALLIAVCIPLANVAAVVALARHQNLHVGRELMRNPLVIATLLGLASNLAGITLPDVAALFLQRLGQASLAMGLLCIGAGLKFPAHAGAVRTLTYFTVLKLIGLPLIAWGVISVMQPQPLETAVLLLFAGLPAASSAYILATRMGGDGAAVAAIVSIQTLVSMLTLPLIIALVPAL